MAKTTSSSSGWSKAWWVAEPSPLVKSTHVEMAANAVRTRATTTGANSAANGAVSRRVTAGSETTHRRRSASSGLGFRSSGSVPSGARSRPSGRSLVSVSRRTSSSPT